TTLNPCLRVKSRHAFARSGLPCVATSIDSLRFLAKESHKTALLFLITQPAIIFFFISAYPYRCNSVFFEMLVYPDRFSFRLFLPPADAVFLHKFLRYREGLNCE